MEEKGHVKLEEEGKESIAVEKADEGDLLMVKRVLIGFQRFEIEPKEDFLPSYENTIIPIPFPPKHFPSKTRKKKKSSFHLSHSSTFKKPSLKVFYHAPRTFREWKIISLIEWSTLFFKMSSLND